MTKIQGQLFKMTVRDTDPVEYSFCLHNAAGELVQSLVVNDFLGKTLTLNYSGKANCIACHRAIKKTFNQDGRKNFLNKSCRTS